MSKNEFDKFIQKYTSGYQAIMVNNKTRSNNPKDMYQIVQAPEKIPNFLLSFKSNECFTVF